jgi:hypothetical protein
VSSWINFAAVGKIMLFGLILGAGLPALFALAVRLNAEGVRVAEHGGQAVAQRNRVWLALSWVVFALVLVAVIVGVLFVARDFIGHHTGLYILGAKVPKGH